MTDMPIEIFVSGSETTGKMYGHLHEAKGRTQYIRADKAGRSSSHHDISRLQGELKDADIAIALAEAALNNWEFLEQGMDDCTKPLVREHTVKALAAITAYRNKGQKP